MIDKAVVRATHGDRPEVRSRGSNVASGVTAGEGRANGLEMPHAEHEAEEAPEGSGDASRGLTHPIMRRVQAAHPTGGARGEVLPSDHMLG